MIYIVSGHMRTGTSMMMQALEAGGLEACFAPGRDDMNQQWGDEHYQPNSGGFYELRKQDYLEAGFPRKYEGKLIKCLAPAVLKICPGDYQIIFMRREYEEIRQSYDAFFGRGLRINKDALNTTMEDSVGVLRQRRDVEVQELWYREVLTDPLGTFQGLGGWPIDVGAAAAVVDPSLCRFKEELLEVGI